MDCQQKEKSKGSGNHSLPLTLRRLKMKRRSYRLLQWYHSKNMLQKKIKIVTEPLSFPQVSPEFGKKTSVEDPYIPPLGCAPQSWGDGGNPLQKG